MMDECTLLGETLDYAVSLKAQVEAMQLLLRTLQAPKNPSSKSPPPTPLFSDLVLSAQNLDMHGG